MKLKSPEGRSIIEMQQEIDEILARIPAGVTREETALRRCEVLAELMRENVRLLQQKMLLLNSKVEDFRKLKSKLDNMGEDNE